MIAFESHARTSLVYGPGAFDRLGELARQLGFGRTLIVADDGMLAAGYARRGADLLAGAGIEAFLFHGFDANPTSAHVAAGHRFAEPLGIDSLIGLGGGSSMDCAKGISFLLANGGRMQDYWGYAKASRPLLPMIGVPTTTGTGSEAQSYALISDADTHVKMACGDPSAAFRIALLDPQLAVSQPVSVRAVAGYDALSHAVETWVTNRRNPMSQMYSREAWRLLNAHFERLITSPGDLDAVAGMQLGAHFAGAAIEHSMLGAAHACANPLTARYGSIHGAAIAAILPHVVRWNEPVALAHYRELHTDTATRVTDLAAVAGLASRIGPLGVPASDLPSLAEDAARQWTGRFNPRPFDTAGAMEVYQCAY